MTVLVRGVRAFASDGSRYVAWQGAGSQSVTVLDTSSGQRRAYVLPNGCFLSDEDSPGTYERLHHGGGGRFLLSCYSGGGDVLDLQTGQVTQLPQEGQRYDWRAVGALYAEDPGCGLREGCESFVELATGHLFTHRGPGPFNLSEPGAPRVGICEALRRTWLADEQHIVANTLFAYAQGVLVQPGRREGSVEIRRCTHAPIVVKGVGEPRDFEATSDYVTWDTGFSSEGSIEAEESDAPTLLNAYDLETHKLRSWRLPALELAAVKEIATFGFSTSNPHAVFWIADETVSPPQGTGLGVLTSAVYTAPL
jgi:hypothetical protein